MSQYCKASKGPITSLQNTVIRELQVLKIISEHMYRWLQVKVLFCLGAVPAGIFSGVAKYIMENLNFRKNLQDCDGKMKKTQTLSTVGPSPPFSLAISGLISQFQA